MDERRAHPRHATALRVTLEVGGRVDNGYQQGDTGHAREQGQCRDGPGTLGLELAGPEFPCWCLVMVGIYVAGGLGGQRRRVFPTGAISSLGLQPVQLAIGDAVSCSRGRRGRVVRRVVNGAGGAGGIGSLGLGMVSRSGGLDRSLGAVFGRPRRAPLHRGGGSSRERARAWGFSVRCPCWLRPCRVRWRARRRCAGQARRSDGSGQVRVGVRCTVCLSVCPSVTGLRRHSSRGTRQIGGCAMTTPGAPCAKPRAERLGSVDRGIDNDG